MTSKTYIINREIDLGKRILLARTFRHQCDVLTCRKRLRILREDTLKVRQIDSVLAVAGFYVDIRLVYL